MLQVIVNATMALAAEEAAVFGGADVSMILNGLAKAIRQTESRIAIPATGRRKADGNNGHGSANGSWIRRPMPADVAMDAPLLQVFLLLAPHIMLLPLCGGTGGHSRQADVIIYVHTNMHTLTRTRQVIGALAPRIMCLPSDALSPQDISLIFNAMARSNYRPATRAARSKGDGSNSVNLAQTTEKVLSRRRRQGDPLLLALSAAACAAAPAAFSGQAIAVTLNAMRQLSFDHIPLLLHLCSSALLLLRSPDAPSHFTPHHIGLTLNAMTALGVTHPPLLVEMSRTLANASSPTTPVVLSNIAHAAACLLAGEEGLQIATWDLLNKTGIRGWLVREMLAIHPHEMGLQGACNCLWSIAVLDLIGLSVAQVSGEGTGPTDGLVAWSLALVEHHFCPSERSRMGRVRDHEEMGWGCRTRGRQQVVGLRQTEQFLLWLLVCKSSEVSANSSRLPAGGEDTFVAGPRNAVNAPTESGTGRGGALEDVESVCDVRGRVAGLLRQVQEQLLDMDAARRDTVGVLTHSQGGRGSSRDMGSRGNKTKAGTVSQLQQSVRDTLRRLGMETEEEVLIWLDASQDGEEGRDSLSFFSGYDVDLFVPSLQTLIEVDGPFHFALDLSQLPADVDGDSLTRPASFCEHHCIDARREVEGRKQKIGERVSGVSGGRQHAQSEFVSAQQRRIPLGATAFKHRMLRRGMKAAEGDGEDVPLRLRVDTQTKMQPRDMLEVAPPLKFWRAPADASKASCFDLVCIPYWEWPDGKGPDAQAAQDKFLLSLLG